MELQLTNRYVVIKHSVDGTPQESDFELKSEKISPPSMESAEDKKVLVKNIYVSIDPYQLNRMKSYSSSQQAINFSSPVIPGQVTLLINYILKFFNCDIGLRN